jgi:cation:H+ antiporter
MEWLKVIVGLLLLILSADKLVEHAAKLAFRLKISPLVIGLTIIGFGTSAPEIFVAIISSLKGNEGIALGNALGSNIANIGLVVGITAILQPITKSTQTIKNELIALLLISFGIYAMLFFLGFSLWVGILLISILAVFLVWLIRTSKQHHEPADTSGLEKNHSSLTKILIGLFISLLILGAGSNLLVDGASQIALSLGVRETFIGLTIVAVGTSLPELSVSIIGIVKKHHGIALGNIIGSNVFNLTAVLAPIAFISQDMRISLLVKYQDFPIMLLLTVLFSLPFLLANQKKFAINRLGGVFLLCTYICYLTLLIYQAKIVV